MSNFRRLVNHLRNEKIRLAEANDPVRLVQQINKNHARFKTGMTKALNTARSLNKRLTPTKAELRKANQVKMYDFRQNLKASVKGRLITNIEAIKAENYANKISAQLLSRGLI